MTDLNNIQKPLVSKLLTFFLKTYFLCTECIKVKKAFYYMYSIEQKETLLRSIISDILLSENKVLTNNKELQYYHVH